MTPKFTTPCYVRVDDLAKQKEIAIKLREMGYKVCPCVTMGGEPFDTPIFVFNALQGDIHILDIPDFGDDFIDCGTNTDLFLALAGMREDTKATATEIIELFKQKGESK